MRRWSILPALLVCGACSGGSSSPRFGLSQRVPVTTLRFPTGLPQPTPLTARPAFPSLLFDAPVVFTFAPDGSNRVFVGELAGRVRVFPNDPNVSSAAVSDFLDLRAANGGPVLTGGEQGLLGLAFHPDYASNGWLYVCYSVDGPRRSRLSRFQVSADPNLVDLGSEIVLLEIGQPAPNHNGGCLAFGPDDKLYYSVGDGGNQHDPGQNAQDLTSLLGKILRLNDDGSAPADNPFVGDPNARDEIWAYGFRNPWRFSFDRQTGDLWCGDVGQSSIEEIDVVTRGGNYGWDFFEGTLYHEGNASGFPLIDPIYEYPRPGGYSVTGGYVSRGPSLDLTRGAYVFGDYGSGRLWALVTDGDQVVDIQDVAFVNAPVSFGEDQDGELYVCSLDGNVYRFEETDPAPVTEVPAQLSATGLFTSVPDLIPAPGVLEYDVNAPFWSDGGHKRRWIALPGNSRIEFSAEEPWTFPTGTVLVKHFEIDTNQGVRRLETRVLVLTASGWQGYPYRWNREQDDATLQTMANTETISVTEDGVTFDLDWFFPGSSDCNTCHTAAAGHVLGLRVSQLNRNFEYPRMTDNQLRAWNHIGLFATALDTPQSYEALVDPTDASRRIDKRARAYLATNCAPCHRPGGSTPVDIDFRENVSVASMNLLGIPATTSSDNLPGALRLDPFSPETSEVWLRMNRLDALRMPPLGSHRRDEQGLEVIGEWIDQGAQ